MSDWSAKNPYMTQITENYILNGEGSRKETRHIVFALGDSGLDYKVGDALGVIAENPPHIVDELLEVQGWDREATVTTHNGERTLYDALKKDFEVHMANKKFVQSLAEKVVSSGMKISMSIVSRTRNDATWSATDDQQTPPALRPSVPSDDPAAQVEAITADTKAIEEQPENKLSSGKGPGQFEGKTCSDEKHERRSEDGPVERMSTESAGPVKVLGRMVDGVKFPQHRNLMIETMCPVHQGVEQQKPNHRQIGRRYFGNVRCDQQPGNPSQTEQTDDDGHEAREQTHQR